MTRHSLQAVKVKRFRELHRSRPGFLIPNAWDAGSARLLAELGFESLATTSAGLAWSLGRPDGAAGREAALANARQIVEAVPLPVSADLENGFGHDPRAVAETVRGAAEVGLAGLSIEDASGDAEGPIYELSHAVERVAAAVEANRSLTTPLVLTARAENFLHGRPDLDDTIQRLRRFAGVGADVLYAPGLPDLEAVRRVCASVDGPVNVLAGGGSPPCSAADLFSAGAQRISVGSALARAAWSGFLEAAREMRDDGGFLFAERSPDYGQLNAAMSRSVGHDLSSGR